MCGVLIDSFCVLWELICVIRTLKATAWYLKSNEFKLRESGKPPVFFGGQLYARPLLVVFRAFSLNRSSRNSVMNLPQFSYTKSSNPVPLLLLVV